MDLAAALRGSAGDRAAAFSRLVDGSLDREFRLATVILGNRADAEDAVGDAALRAWQHVAQLRDPARFEPWFTRIVVNVCRDRLHRRRPTTPLTLDPPAGTDAIADSIERAALLDALRTLTADHRAVIALHYLEGLTIEQIADHLAMPIGTVKSRLHYGLAELRAAYDAAAREPGRTLR
ncbi:MAG TPA: sigma-70 family RNA polymerase sigma factor [Candidatus Limnocylindria bacterium]